MRSSPGYATYVNEIIKYVNNGISDINWSTYNDMCEDDRDTTKKMSCKQKSKNKISQELFKLGKPYFTCSPGDCTQDQGANDPSVIFNIFANAQPNILKIIEVSNLEDRRLSSIAITETDFEGKDIIVVRKLNSSPGDGGGIVDTPIESIRRINNNETQYNLVSVEMSSGPIHYIPVVSVI